MTVPSRAERMPSERLESILPSSRVATVERVIEETFRVKTTMLDVPEWLELSDGACGLDCLRAGGPAAGIERGAYPGRRGLPVPN